LDAAGTLSQAPSHLGGELAKGEREGEREKEGGSYRSEGKVADWHVLESRAADERFGLRTVK